ncbi:lysosomal amino acid transporter 1 homolog isoform X2 [Ambystoma mexicanum]|uniref:lysosomal amino acid transporter 1 homolog isoform X2 n=1 Tax=Ambystoma mexicanum TaxID=8296 RepID=UPI0037E8069D
MPLMKSCLLLETRWAYHLVSIINRLAYEFILQVVKMQYWQSCKTGNMDKALSIWFLLAWLFGDSCNLVGAFLAHQLPLQTYTAVYYVMADVLMLSLFSYYKFRNKSQLVLLTTPINALCAVTLLGVGTSLSVFGRLKPSGLDISVASKGRSLLSVGEQDCLPFSTNEKIGTAIGSLSSVLYLLSRVPQIITNFRRKSTEGVAGTLFVMAILGNLTYGLSVLMKNPEKDQSESNYVLHHLPWLVGSLGVVSLDLFILFQFFIYRKQVHGATDREEADPLISS